MKGVLYLIPTTLGDSSVDLVIPKDVQHITRTLRYFVVENIRTARRYLRKIDTNFPIDETVFFELNKHTKLIDLDTFICPLKQGFSMGLISEAGCPAVADPGSELVALAHKYNIDIRPLVGPSSILLALMGSGFSGQEFTFHGYLPKDQKQRIQKIKAFETNARKLGKTHIFMETPFRNNHLKEDLFAYLSDQTMVCIASNLTTSQEFISTMSVAKWRTKTIDLTKKPTLFLIGVVNNVILSSK